LKLTDLNKLSIKRAEALEKSGISTPADLLMLFPHRYIDKTRVHPIHTLSGHGETVTVIGKVKHVSESGYGKKKRLEVIIADDTGILKGVWFRGGSYFKKILKKDSLVSFFGTVKRFGRYLSIAHPEVEQLDSENDAVTGQKIVPVYPGGAHLSKVHITHKLIHNWINEILNSTRPAEFLPDSLLKKRKFPNRIRAFQMIHNPSTLREPDKALERFKYEELFLFELSMSKIKQVHLDKNTGPVFKSSGILTNRFFREKIPFNLTEGQKSALKDIRNDLISGMQMHRLIQGDVGAGKTVVAIGAILLALDSGYQAAFMAPTEILAEQHYHTLTGFLNELDIEIRLLTGGQNSTLRTDILTSIEGGRCQVVIGTHAIIQEQVNFHKLGLAVIDEQHRFGVKQRAEMLNKGNSPHLLVMSATPIPRSLAMTIYSDLDISVIKGLPAGRKPIRTAIRTDKKREEVYSFLNQNIHEGGQAYIVYPLIEESEVMDLKDATMGYEKLKNRFPDARIDLLHGRIKSEKKEEIMSRFVHGELDILVSTTVIEVGVDVPNANVMIIEHAERFGLSQLHQLRGRIGRGNRQSYCILMPGEKLSKQGRFRLNKMVETSDGFDIAEADLKLRGPGDFLGTKQSGLPEFRYADIVDDRMILELAKQDAWQLIRDDPELNLDEHLKLKTVFDPYFKEKAEYFGLG
jgi:ATP-dependent DNA helicase RecG